MDLVIRGDNFVSGVIVVAGISGTQREVFAGKLREASVAASVAPFPIDISTEIVMRSSDKPDGGLDNLDGTDSKVAPPTATPSTNHAGLDTAGDGDTTSPATPVSSLDVAVATATPVPDPDAEMARADAGVKRRLDFDDAQTKQPNLNEHGIEITGEVMDLL